jgi:hypothetical protein
MRPKFILVLLSAVLAVSGILFFLKQADTRRATTDSDPKTVVAVAAPPPVASASKSVPMINTSTKAAEVPVSPEEHQAAIDTEVGRLQDLSANNDAASLTAILGDLTSPDKAIRLAAIEAAKQFGSSEAIPTLKADAATATDLEEQTAMLDAADVLSTPDMTLGGSGNGTPETPQQIQTAQQKYATMQAQRQAQLQTSRGAGHNQQQPTGQSAALPGGAPSN